MPDKISRRQFTAALGAAAAGAFGCSQESGESVTASLPPDETYRIIDPHVHVWKHDPNYPWPAELTQPPEGDALPETLLDLMAANGVSHTVIVHVIHYRWDCRYTAAVIKQYPDKFQGVCRVNPQSPTAPEDLSRWVEEYGYRGVRLSPAVNESGDWINGPLMVPLWQRTRELKIPMTILTRTQRLPDVEKRIGQFEDLDVVIDHMADCPVGQPEELAKLLALAKYPKVFVKISHTWSISQQDYPYRDSWENVKAIYDAFGPQRLMWGTDWPLVEDKCGYAKALALVRDEMDFLNAEDKRWILGGTVERIWPFSKA